MNSASEHRSLLTIFAQTTPNDWLGGVELVLLLCASTCRGPLPQPHIRDYTDAAHPVRLGQIGKHGAVHLPSWENHFAAFEDTLQELVGGVL